LIFILLISLLDCTGTQVIMANWRAMHDITFPPAEQPSPCIPYPNLYWNYWESSRRVHEVKTSSLESQISHLTTLVESLVAGNSQQARVCGVCAQPNHPTDMCPMFQEDVPQMRYDPYWDTYNPGWRDHPNFGYGAGPQNLQQNQFGAPQPQQPSSSKQGMSLEDIVQSIAANTLQFQQEMKQFQQEMKASL
jgi:hypothetical protein